jgi:branched-chain amino acid transport system permease protein
MHIWEAARVLDAGLLQVIVDGFAMGSIYCGLALALVLIFKSTGIINFALGEMGMFCTFVVWWLHEAGLPLLFSLGLGLVFAFALGVVVERASIRAIVRYGETPTVITTLGLFLVCNELAPWIWGPENRAFPSLFGESVVSIFGAHVAASSIGIVAVMMLALLAFFWLLHRTKIGLAMRAAASNPVSSGLAGIPPSRIFMLGWGLATALSCLVGVLIAPRLFLDSSLMLSVIIYAFAAAALGGFQSLPGAVLGGIIIGLIENLASNYIDFIGADLKILVPLGVMLFVLLVKPTGLLGQAAERRV